MVVIRLVFILSLTLLLPGCFGERTSKRSESIKIDRPSDAISDESFTSSVKGNNLRYKVRHPQHKDLKKPPLLIMLHGYGSDENNMYELAKKVDQKYAVVSVRAPIELGKASYCWYQLTQKNGERVSNTAEETESLDEIIQLIPRLHQELSTNPEKTFVLGFSQGAMMAFSVALKAPGQVAGVVSIGGGLSNTILSQPLLEANAYKDLEIFIAHGQKDQIIPVQTARNAQIFFEDYPVEMTYREYKSMGHSVSPACFKDINNWLFQKGKVR